MKNDKKESGIEDINAEYRDLETRRKQMQEDEKKLNLSEEEEIEKFIKENKEFNKMLKNSNFKTIDYNGGDKDGKSN